MTGVQTCALPICFPVTIAGDISPENNKYLFVINSDGTRATSYLLGLHGATYDELRAKAQEAFPNCTYVEGTEAEQQLFYKNYTYENGTMTAPPAPTAEELRQKSLLELDSKYSNLFNELDKQITNAVTVLQDTEYADELRQKRTDLATQYATERSAL